MKFSEELDFVMMHLVTKQDNLYGLAFKSYHINSLYQFATICDMEAERIVKLDLFPRFKNEAKHFVHGTDR